MKLQEILDSKVPYEVVTSTARTFRAKAKIGGRYITFEADDNMNGGWDIQFSETDGDEGSSPAFGKTGRGNELAVFSMVSAAFKEFLDRYHPPAITFTADKDDKGSDTRAKLYRKLLDKYLKGWTRDEIEYRKSTHFTYTKEDPDSQD